MLAVKAYAATSATEPLNPATIERRDLGPHDVLIEIKYCGICHSDIHYVRGEWGSTSSTPSLPGTRSLGSSTEVGSEVTRHAVGDRVGVGCMVDSCGECANCRKGEEQYCVKGSTLTYGSVDEDGRPTHGGYSTHIVVHRGLRGQDPRRASNSTPPPRCCAPASPPIPRCATGAPARARRLRSSASAGSVTWPSSSPHAMGAEVTVLSQSLKKQEDGLRLGADHYYSTSDPATFSELGGSFDLIVNTVSAKIDLDAYLWLLAVDGTLVNVGAPAEPLSLHVFSLLMGRRSFTGSLIGGIRETQEMLDFCGEHHLGAEIEVIPVDKINEAYERVLASDVRYRFVIDTSTLH